MSLRVSRRVWVAALGLLVMVASPASLAANGADIAATEGRRVVVLNSADPNLPAFLVLDRSMREAVLAAHPTTALYAEALDMFRFPQAQVEPDVVALLTKKYRDLKVDVVVAAGSPSLQFLLRHADTIWPGAALVFHSVSEQAIPALRLGARITGVPSRLAFEPTLELALKLRPRTRRVLVIGGVAELDQSVLAAARRDTERWQPSNVDVQYLVGASTPELVKAVRALPDDSVVFFLTVFRDHAGIPTIPRDVLTQIAPASKAPIFGIYETYVGAGIVGGSIATYSEQGQRAGELVARVLNGEDPRAIGILSPGAPGCVVDARQLQRWDIAERLVPAGCDVRFREASLWDRYRWQILAVLCVVLLQFVLIAALAYSRRHLRRAQAEVNEELILRREAEALAGRLRSSLARMGRQRSLGTMASAISHEIGQPLIAIQNYAQALRRRIKAGPGDGDRIADLVDKIQGQAERAGAITQRVRSLVSTSQVQLAPIDLVPVLEEVVALVKPEFENSSASVVLSTELQQAVITGDALSLQLVIANLLRNALDSITSGSCDDRTVSVTVAADEPGAVTVRVIDRGAGVDEAVQKEIFEPLVSGKSDHMGMGLATARAVVEAHRSTLWYQTNPAGGAIFGFSLRTTEA